MNSKAPKRKFVETDDFHQVGTLTVGTLTASFVRTGDEIADVTFDGMGKCNHARMMGMVLKSAASRWADHTDLFDAIKDKGTQRGRMDCDLLFDLGEMRRCEDGTIVIEIHLATTTEPSCYATVELRVIGDKLGLKCTSEPMEPTQLWAFGSLLDDVQDMLADTPSLSVLAQAVSHHFTHTLGAENLKIALAEDGVDL